jgi:hypothetical protein
MRLARLSSATAGTACSKRDDADVYAGPEMRVVRSATPHPYLYISLPPSLPSPHPCSLTTLTTAQSTPSPACVVANDAISDGVEW